jgi:XTP/dITP diphosphohydrolase
MLLARLASASARDATFVSVIVLLRHPEDPEPVVAQGRWRGQIARAPRGANGFGYDPLFIVAGRNLTAAEIGADEKNRISHRGQALERLLVMLRERSR